MNRVVLAFAGLAVASPAFAQMSGTSWVNQCTPGAFQACASVTVTTVFDPVTQLSRIAMRVSNLQGLEPWIPDPGPSSLAFFSVSGLEAEPPSFCPGCMGGSWNTFGSASLEGNATGTAFPELSAFMFTPTSSAMFEGSGTTGARVFGCGGSPLNVQGAFGPGDGVTTCGGWLVMSFDIPGKWTVGGQTTMGFQAAGDTWSASCETGSTCTMVTPEPATLLLLASGLTGIFAIWRRGKNDGPLG